MTLASRQTVNAGLLGKRPAEDLRCYLVFFDVLAGACVEFKKLFFCLVAVESIFENGGNRAVFFLGGGEYFFAHVRRECESYSL